MRLPYRKMNAANLCPCFQVIWISIDILFLVEQFEKFKCSSKDSVDIYEEKDLHTRFNIVEQCLFCIFAINTYGI